MHIKEEATEKPSNRYSVDCEVCGKTTRDSWDLKRHTKRYHENSYKCTICEEHFFVIKLGQHIQKNVILNVKNVILRTRYLANLKDTYGVTCGKRTPLKILLNIRNELQ